MTELYICDNANNCTKDDCPHIEPHKYGDLSCGIGKCTKYKIKVECIPAVEDFIKEEEILL